MFLSGGGFLGGGKELEDERLIGLLSSLLFFGVFSCPVHLCGFGVV